ncbi:MAG: BatA and WFA domain-containing protein [Deltaproteobacteria bacterium]|nr:BatA and WFA domain-containing protein [Deltaproteobacteria bacterium]
MAFLYPLYLAALVTAVIPLVIHLLNRRQQKRLRFPAVRFVLISQRRVARTYNLRNWLLLAVRTLAIIFLVLLMAHPLWETGAGLSARGAPLATAIVVDNSLSMQVREQGAPFTEAKQAAGRILEALDDGDRAAVIATNPVGRRQPSLKDPREAALKDLEPLTVTAGAADFTAALRTAYGLLGGSGGQKALWVVTDLGLSGWDRLSLPAVGEYDPTVPLKIVTVGSSEAAPAATITALASSAAHVAPGLDIGLAATLGSFAADPIPEVAARLTIDGKVRDEKRVALSPDAESTVDFRFTLDRPGGHSGHVSLHADGLSGNLRHYFTLHTRERLNVLLVDGDPQRALVASETFFLSRALNPSGDVANSVLLPEVILPGAVGQVDPSAYQAVILANVAALPPAFVARLAAFVEGGGGLLLSLGDRVAPEDYNRALWNNASPLLPGPLGQRRRVPLDRNVTVGEVDVAHPALEAFDDQRLLDSLRSAKVSSYFEVSPVGGRTLMRLSDGSPLLIEKTLGKGRVLLLTSTADSAWNNLPLKTGYVPLVQSLVTSMTGGGSGSIDTGITAGTVKRWSAGAAHAGKRLRVVDPKRGENDVALEPADGEAAGAFAGNHFAGIYRVVSPGGGLDIPALYAVNPPPVESRPERIGADELARKLGPVNHEVLSAGALAEGGSRTDLALALVVLLLLTLLFESWLGQRNYE